MTHTSTAIRNTGQQLAKGKFQEGSIRAMFAIKELAIAMLGRSGMVWVDENSNEDGSKRLCEDTTKKLAFVRAVWNIKDIGRSAAENGIEKAVVTAADILYDLLAKALKSDKVWCKSETEQQDGSKETQDSKKIQEYQHHKKTEGLLSISEGFYEIAMIAKEKRLKDALTKIIYYNVISVRCLDKDKGGDYNRYPALNTYLRTFVDLQMIGEFTTKGVQGFLEELSLDQDLKSHKEYKEYFDEFSKRICEYYSKKSRTPDTKYQRSVRSIPDGSRAPDTEYRSSVRSTPDGSRAPDTEYRSSVRSALDGSRAPDTKYRGSVRSIPTRSRASSTVGTAHPGWNRNVACRRGKSVYSRAWRGQPGRRLPQVLPGGGGNSAIGEADRTWITPTRCVPTRMCGASTGHKSRHRR